ncbi:hypothetical protein N9Z18_00210 [Verrucomicrobiales bacterium]|nr:hypothetical protein [Verrucomicrobiales bacterium]
MSNFIIQIEKLIHAVSDPEYRYLLLEPLILYGILTGVILMIVSLAMKVHKLQIAALVTLGIAAIAHSPYLEARQAAQPRIEQVYKISSPARAKGFKENSQAWVEKAWQFKLLVLIAVLTFLIGVNRNKFGFWLAVSSVVLGLVAAKNTLWLNYQDAIAYHPNLQTHEAPVDKKVVSSPPPAAKKTASVTASKPAPKPQPKTAPKPQPRPVVSAAPQQQASRVPVPPAVLPLAPAALTQPLSAPAPRQRSNPNSSGYGASRIPAPDMPVNRAAPAPAPGPKARSVQPLPRYNGSLPPPTLPTN